MHQSHLMNDDEVPLLEERGPGEGKPGGRLGPEVFWLEKEDTFVFISISRDGMQQSAVHYERSPFFSSEYVFKSNDL